MRVLMFGWEFPPHIAGGLGTACYGLTKGMAETGDIQLIFVVPKVWGDENPQDFELMGANQVPIARIENSEIAGKGVEFIGVKSSIIPYTSPDEFWELKTTHNIAGQHFIEVNEDGFAPFSGSYGPGLHHEIRNYALVAGELATQQAFDVIHAHDWLTFPAGIAAKQASGKPLVVHVHATDFDRSGGNPNPTVYFIEREAMETADRVITVSNLTRKTVIEKYGIAPQKVVTVHNAVMPLQPRKRAEYKKIAGEKIVTFMGRITIQKGPGYFVEAANLILKRLPNVRFVMAGSGDMAGPIIEHAARLGISNRFHFTGFIRGEEVYSLLDITDVFVMPSVSEPFGIAPLEAMQAGVPVIVSKQSGVAEIVEHIFTVDFWDTYAMADAIYGLIKYPGLSGFFSKNGVIEARSLKWKNAAGLIKDIYKELVTDTPAGYVPVIE